MKTSARFLISGAMACLAMAIGLQVAHASGPIGLYARIDKVTLKPAGDKPQLIRIDGVFSIKGDNAGTYSAPQSGYVYFALLADRQELARNEWNDLKSVQPGAVIGLGSVWDGPAQVHVRKAGEPEANPDPYPMGNGLVRMNASNAHAKALFDYR
jgi:hypothetical protein